MKLLKPTSGSTLSYPRRVALLMFAMSIWLVSAFFITSHIIAIARVSDSPPEFNSDGCIYQSTDFSCGPACLATIFNSYNILKSESEWAELAMTSTTMGTTLTGLRHAAAEMGFETVIVDATYEQLDLIGDPAIIFQSDEYHLVTFWGMDSSGRAIIRDPVLGRIKWDLWDYQTHTPESPKLLVFRPGYFHNCDSESARIEIARAQNMLKELGYFWGTIDGEWSIWLEDALIRFQGDMDLEQTGIMDEVTGLLLEGTWRVATQGPFRPVLPNDQYDSDNDRNVPILIKLGIEVD